MVRSLSQTTLLGSLCSKGCPSCPHFPIASSSEHFCAGVGRAGQVCQPERQVAPEDFCEDTPDSAACFNSAVLAARICTAGQARHRRHGSVDQPQKLRQRHLGFLFARMYPPALPRIDDKSTRVAHLEQDLLQKALGRAGAFGNLLDRWRLSLAVPLVGKDDQRLEPILHPLADHDSILWSGVLNWLTGRPASCRARSMYQTA